MSQIPDFEAATERLTPEAYNALLPAIALGELTLEGVNASVNREAVVAADQFALRMSRDEWTYELDDREHPTLVGTYIVQGLWKRKAAVKLAVTYRIHLEAETELPVEFFVIYGNSSADLHAWPFVRELVYSLTARMEVPRLTLPLLLNPRSLVKARRPRRSAQAAE